MKEKPVECKCGNKLMPDAAFCRKCGTERPVDNDGATDGKPGAIVHFINGTKKHYRKSSFQARWP